MLLPARWPAGLRGCRSDAAPADLLAAGGGGRGEASCDRGVLIVVLLLAALRGLGRASIQAGLCTTGADDRVQRSAPG